MEKEEQAKNKKIYGFQDDEAKVIFNTRKEAEIYNERFCKGMKIIQEYNFYENCDEYEKENPQKNLARLCRDKAILVNSIEYPFVLTRVHVDRGWEKLSHGSSFSTLKELLTLANKQLKELFQYPQNVNDSEMLKIQIKEYIVKITAEQCNQLYNIFQDISQKVNVINKEIADVIIGGKIQDEEYQTICKMAMLNEESRSTEEKTYEFEMLNKEAYIDNNYLMLD